MITLYVCQYFHKFVIWRNIYFRYIEFYDTKNVSIPPESAAHKTVSLAHKYNRKYDMLKVVNQHPEQYYSAISHQVILELFLRLRHNISPPDLQGADQPEVGMGDVCFLMIQCFNDAMFSNS